MGGTSQIPIKTKLFDVQFIDFCERSLKVEDFVTVYECPNRSHGSTGRLCQINSENELCYYNSVQSLKDNHKFSPAKYRSSRFIKVLKMDYRLSVKWKDFEGGKTSFWYITSARVGTISYLVRIFKLRTPTQPLYRLFGPIKVCMYSALGLSAQDVVNLHLIRILPKLCSLLTFIKPLYSDECLKAKSLGPRLRQESGVCWVSGPILPRDIWTGYRIAISCFSPPSRRSDLSVQTLKRVSCFYLEIRVICRPQRVVFYDGQSMISKSWETNN